MKEISVITIIKEKGEEKNTQIWWSLVGWVIILILY